MLFFIYLGNTITTKRNSKILVNASKLQAERDKVFVKNQENFLELLESLQKTVVRLSCQVDMRKKINIDDYLPIKTDYDVERFLNKSDGLFHCRREEFENMLYLNVTNNIKLKRPFETYLLHAIFSREFISSHKWPGPR